MKVTRGTLPQAPWPGAIMRAREGLDTDGVRLNVVFHIAGQFVKQSFEGVRTGSFRKADRLLMAQVALPEVAPPDAFEQVLALAHEAVAAVEPWSKWRKVLFEREVFTALLDSLEIVERDPSTVSDEEGACTRTFKTPLD